MAFSSIGTWNLVLVVLICSNCTKKKGGISASLVLMCTKVDFNCFVEMLYGLFTENMLKYKEKKSSETAEENVR